MFYTRYSETPTEGRTNVFTLPKFKSEPTSSDLLEDEIKRTLEALKILQKFDDPGVKVLDEHLTALYKLKEIDSKSKLSRDAMLAALTSIVGVLIVISYEHGHAIASKTFNSVFGRTIR